MTDLKAKSVREAAERLTAYTGYPGQAADLQLVLDAYGQYRMLLIRAVLSLHALFDTGVVPNPDTVAAARRLTQTIEWALAEEVEEPPQVQPDALTSTT